MFFPTICRYAKVLIFVLSLSLPASAAVITEGDVALNFDVFIAQSEPSGSLTLTAPTTLQGGGIFIAGQPGFEGSMIVDGAAFESSGNVFEIGQQGDGSLEIINGGAITVPNSSTGLIVASDSTATGEVLVSGSGSLLDMPNSTAILGGTGYATFTVENGARANHRSAFVGGDQFQGIGIGTATVRDSGSRWEIGEELIVGSGGSGELWIQNGGQVHSNFGDNSHSAIVGGNPNNSEPSSATGMVVVEGQGSLWHHHGQPFDSSEIAVGVGGNGTVAIRSGGKVISQKLTVGGSAFNSLGGTGLVTIDGFGSQWITQNLEIGRTGIGQVLLTNGAKLINNNQSGGSTVLGSEQGTFGKLVVDGITTQWIDNSQNLIIGDQGSAELVIRNGAFVNSSNVTISQNPSAQGTARIEGQGTRWNVESIDVGFFSDGESKLEIRDNATLILAPFGGNAFVGSQGELKLHNGTMSSVGQFANEGIVTGSGQINSTVFFNNNGTIRVNPTDRLILSGTLSNGQGRTDIVGGELEVDDLDNGSGSTITMESATLRTNIAFINNAALAVAIGSNRIYGDIQNTSNGNIILSGNSQTTFYDDIQNQGQINVATGSVATFFGEVAGNGVGGGGTVFLEGDISPGFSPGVMSFGGDVSLGDFSDLTVELAGTTPGDGFDQLQIAGQASLGGELILDAQAPLGDVTLTILEADSILGEFDTIPALFSHIGAGMFLTDITYGLNEVTISLVEGLADFDLNGFVDEFDLATWQNSFGSASGAGLADGDANGSSNVDGVDFLVWQRRFSPMIPEASAVAQAVPEPSALVLLAMAMSYTVTRRSCR